MPTNKPEPGSTPSPSRLIDTREAASLLGVSNTTVRELMYRRELPPIHVGRSLRFRLCDVLAFIDQQVPATRTGAA